jgi:hypothetical protein
MALSERAIVDWDTVKTVLGLTNDDQQTFGELLIESESARLESEIRGKIKAQDVLWEFSGHCGKALVLLDHPVSDIEVRIDPDRAFGDETILDPTDYVVDSERGILYRQPGWPEGLLNIRVSGMAGWTEVPPDITDACLRLIKFTWSDFKGDRMNIRGQTGPTGIRTDFETGIPFMVLKVINKYCKVAT